MTNRSKLCAEVLGIFRAYREAVPDALYMVRLGKYFLLAGSADRELKMTDNASLRRRWESYSPSKGIWFWSCMACICATLVIGFTWGGWVTGGTATKMVSDAAKGRARNWQRPTASAVSNVALTPSRSLRR